MYIALIVLGILIVAGLAFYAGKLLSQLNEQKVRFAEAKVKQAQVRAQRIDNIMMSVHTIALAIEQQQCDLSEGVIRLTNLLDALPLNPAPNFSQIYPNIYQLHERIADFATHEARAALTKKVRREQDIAREAIAADFETGIIAEVILLRDYHPTF